MPGPYRALHDCADLVAGAPPKRNVAGAGAGSPLRAKLSASRQVGPALIRRLSKVLE